MTGQSAITDQLPVMTDEGTQMLFVVMRREEHNWDGWTDGNLWTVSVSVGAAHDDSTSLVSMDVYDIPSPPIANGPMAQCRQGASGHQTVITRSGSVSSYSM